MTTAVRPPRPAANLLPSGDALTPSRARRLLALSVMAGFVWKLASVLIVLHSLPVYAVSGWDPGSYFIPAMEWAHGQGFHSEFRTPGYPAFLALLFRLTGDPNPISPRNLVWIAVSQSALLSLGGIPVYAAVKRLTANERVALLGAFVWGFNNSARYHAGLVLTEALTASLMCAWVYALVRCFHEPKRLWFAITGLLMVALTLTRPSTALLAVPVGCGFVWDYVSRRREDRRPRTLLIALILAVALPLMVPGLWAMRNQRVEGERYFTRLSVFGVYAYSFGSAVDVSRGKEPDFWGGYFGEFFRRTRTMTPQAMDTMYRERCAVILKRNPRAVAKQFFASVVFLFLPSLNSPPGLERVRDTLKPSFWRTLPPSERPLYLFYFLNSALELALTLAMVALCVTSVQRRNRPRSPEARAFMGTAALAFTYWILIHAIAGRYAGCGRFLFPAVPLLIVAAAGALDARGRQKAERYRSAPVRR